MLFPSVRDVPPPYLISTFSRYAGSGIVAVGGSTPASNTYPTANRAHFVPFYFPRPLLVTKLWCANGLTASGNTDMGIYDLAGNRIVSAGSTAQAGTSVLQFFDIADTWVVGNVVLGLSHSDATGTILKVSPVAPLVKALGHMIQATAHPLPNPATFAAAAANVLLFGFAIRSSP